MKAYKSFRAVIILSGILLSACAAAPSSRNVSSVGSLSAAALGEAASSAPQVASTEAPAAFDNKGIEAIGTVQAITDKSITVDGQTYIFAPGVEIKGIIAAGALVKLHIITNADGSLSVREVEFVDPTQITSNGVNDNSIGTSVINDNPSTHDINDDHSSSSQPEVHHSNDDNGNDNHGSGGNSNDDDSKGGHG